MWSESSPIAETASFNAFEICLDVMWSMRAAPPAYSCAPNGQTTPCSRQVLGGPCFAPCPWTHREIWAAPPAYPYAPNGRTTPCSRQVLGGLCFRGLRGVTWRRRNDFCALFFLLWDFDVLTRTHGKETARMVSWAMWDDCKSIWEWGLLKSGLISRLKVAPRLGSSFATGMWAFTFATGVWTLGFPKAGVFVCH